MDHNTAAERKHAREQGNLADAADRLTKDDLSHARDDLIEKLVEGKKVGSITALGIFEDAMQVSGLAGYQGVMDLLGGILHLNNYDRDCDDAERAQKLAKEAAGFIERYVDANPDLIRERAEELAS